MQQDKGTLNLETGFLILAFFLFFVKPRLEIDGTDVPVKGWGKSSHVVEAGARQVVVYFPYFTKKRTGEASIQVDVRPGSSTTLKYRAPLIMTAGGKLTQG